VKKNYQRKAHKSNRKLEVVGGQELLVQVPLPMAEVWAEMQAKVEELAGQAGLQILQAILEEEVRRRVGPPNLRSRLNSLEGRFKVPNIESR
jgi:hypothetical protein